MSFGRGFYAAAAAFGNGRDKRCIGGAKKRTIKDVLS